MTAEYPTSGVGIVLSGGGTRGLAHVGVLRALEEHGIRPERVAGTSSGAIVGALYAAGYDPPAMLEFFIRKNPFRLSKVAFTGPGIIDTDMLRLAWADNFIGTYFSGQLDEVQLFDRALSAADVQALVVAAFTI